MVGDKGLLILKSFLGRLLQPGQLLWHQDPTIHVSSLEQDSWSAWQPATSADTHLGQLYSRVPPVRYLAMSRFPQHPGGQTSGKFQKVEFQQVPLVCGYSDFCQPATHDYSRSQISNKVWISTPGAMAASYLCYPILVTSQSIVTPNSCYS